MKKFICFFFTAFSISFWAKAEDVPTLPIGSSAPDFQLLGVDGKEYSLSSFKDAKVLVVLFTCNHCPTAQAYEDRVQALVNTYGSKGVSLVAISPNADKAVRFDELGYTDLNDSYAEMQTRAKDKNFTYPYLYDGETQSTAKAYGPIATPHAFVFDQNRRLQYTGRIDDDEHPGKEKTHELADAIDAVLSGKTPDIQTTKVFGCSVKWLSKEASKNAEVESWAKEPVSVQEIDTQGIKTLLMGDKAEGKFRLINVWATWCGPCVAEFSGLTETDKMYRNRDFEFITISADEPESKDKVQRFLTKKYASNINYLYTGGSKYDLIEAIDPAWAGALPYTVLLSPEGKKIYTQMGEVNIQELRKAVVEQLGRFYK